MTSVTKNFFNLSASQRPTVGDTKLSMVNYDHLGWFLCDGRTLQISEYQVLYNVIGRSYGSNGPTTFKLPNPAGRVLGVIGTG
jgi:microcystin-dependent protein